MMNDKGEKETSWKPSTLEVKEENQQSTPQTTKPQIRVCNNSRRRNENSERMMKKSLTQSQILYYFLGPETRHWSTVAESQNLLTMYESWFTSKKDLPVSVLPSGMILVLYLFTFQLYIPYKRVDLLRIRESTMEQHSRNQEESNSVQQLQSSMKRFQPLQIHKHLHWLQWIEQLIEHWARPKKAV